MGIEPSQGNSSAPFLYAERYIADAEGQLWTPAEFEIQQRVRGEGDEVSSEDAEYGEPIQTSSSAVRESGSPQLHLLLSAESGARSPSGQARTLDGELLSSGSPKILEGPRGGTSSASQSTRVVRPGDIVVVEGDTPPFSGRRTFEFRHGDQIDLAKGNIGVESELGKRLGSCLEDDCIEVLVDEKSSYLLVVGFKTKG
jgi:hypothetical protein